MLVMASKLYDYTPTELQKLLDESSSYADVLRKVTLNPKGGNPRTLKKIIAEYNLDETKLNENRNNFLTDSWNRVRKTNKGYLLEDILDGKHPNYHSSMLLERLIKAGYKERQCERCGITDWMGEKIAFHLHHNDGDHNNNKLENLMVLCPNCHSQTDNFAGKSSKKHISFDKRQELKQRQVQSGLSEDGQRFYNEYGDYKILCPVCEQNFMNKEATMCRQCYDEKRRKPKVSKEELLKIMENNTYTSAANLLGVDRETVSKWSKYYGLQAKGNNSIYPTGRYQAPPREVLKSKIRAMPLIKIGREYNVSDQTIRKWCDYYHLPRNKSTIKKMSDEEWANI